MYSTSAHYTLAERAPLDFALAAAAQPNAVTDDLFAQVRAYWTEGQVVKILGVVAMSGFLNRRNDSLATPLEAEAPPLDVAQKAASGEHIWLPGKHGQPVP